MIISKTKYQFILNENNKKKYLQKQKHGAKEDKYTSFLENIKTFNILREIVMIMFSVTLKSIIMRIKNYRYCYKKYVYYKKNP